MTREFCVSGLFEVIREPESPPAFWNDREPIRYPHDEGMFQSCYFFQGGDIWLVGDTFVFYHSEKIPEYLFLPGVLWWMSDIESRESTGTEVRTIGR